MQENEWAGRGVCARGKGSHGEERRRRRRGRAVYHGSGEAARPCRRREFRHGRHGPREETANRITLGGRGRFLTVDLPPDTPPLLGTASLGYGGQGSTRGDIRNEVSLSLSVTLRGQLARPLNHPSAAIWCSLFRHARGSKLAADVGHKPPGTGTNLPSSRLSCHHAVPPLYLPC